MEKSEQLTQRINSHSKEIKSCTQNMVSSHFHRFITQGVDQGPSKTINKNQNKLQKKPLQIPSDTLCNSVDA
jgi:hypothetical protein